MEEVSNFCPAMAVPMTVKIPEPMTAPIPRAVREMGPRVFLSLRSGSSESVISLSIDLQQKSWLSEVRMTSAGSVDCDKRLGAPGCSFQLSALSFQLKTCVAARRSGRGRPLLHEFGFYRLAWPRASFLTLGFFDPRA